MVLPFAGARSPAVNCDVLKTFINWLTHSGTESYMGSTVGGTVRDRYTKLDQSHNENIGAIFGDTRQV